MSIKTSELLGLLDAPKDLIEGIEKGEKTLDDFKSYFQTTFISKSMALEDSDIKNSVTGKALGSITTKAKSLFGFEKKDIEGKRVEDVIEMGVLKFQSEIAELKKLQSTTGDKAILDFQEKLTKAEKIATDYKSLADTNAQLLDQEKKTYSSKIKEFKLNNIFSSTKGKIPFKDGITEIEKEGFESYLQKNYKVDLNDNDEPEIFNKTGERVKTETGNKFVTLEELLMVEAKKNNLLKQNNTGNGQKQNPNNYLGINANGNNGHDGSAPQRLMSNGKPIPERRIHPRALINEEK